MLLTSDLDLLTLRAKTVGSAQIVLPSDTVLLVFLLLKFGPDGVQESSIPGCQVAVLADFENGKKFMWKCRTKSNGAPRSYLRT